MIKFKVHNVKLPPSEAPTGNFDITVSTGYAGAYYPVDNKVINNLFLATRAAFGSGSIMTASIIANEITSYTFTLQNNNPILRNGFLIILIPAEVMFTQTPKCD